MAEILYVALLRGINVGGNNIIKKADLKACFESMHFSDVRTYIQSGNVLFRTEEQASDKLIDKVQTSLSGRFDYNSQVVIVSQNQLKNIVENAPPDFGKYPDEYRYDVLFLKDSLTSDEALAKIRTKEGVDRVYPGKRVLYFSRLISKASQSYMSKLVGTAVYKQMTIRNWNTTTKLLAMAEKPLP